MSDYVWQVFDAASTTTEAEGVAATLEAAKEAAGNAYVRRYGMEPARVDLTIDGPNGESWLAGRQTDSYREWRQVE